MNRKALFWGAASLAAGLLVGASSSALAALTGAVFTTDGGCTGVNVNLFPSKEAVYLNGGPRRLGSAGLPDGEYYVKVTEPDGTLLGTSIGTGDETPVVVVNGEFVTCYQLSSILASASDPTQAGYDTTTNPGGEYKVWVSRSSLFVESDSKTDNFKVVSVDEGQNTSISGRKFYDANADGTDDAETGIAGVRIRIFIDYPNDDPDAGLVLIESAPGSGYTLTTDATGAWSFGPIPAGSYVRVEEILPGTGNECYWVQTAPQAGYYAGTVGSEPVEGLDFGNLCVCPATRGFTLGYWSNRNGEAVLNSNPSWIALLVALNLRNADGSNFDPVFYNGLPSSTALRPWLLNGNAVNMAYMLSVQLAATRLDVAYKGLDGTEIVLLTPDLADCYGSPLAQINAVISQANAALGADGYTPSGDPNREHQECLKNILDAINNNRLPVVESSPCPVVYP